MISTKHTAPPACQTCAHLEARTIHIAPLVEVRAYCRHPTGAKPMHEPCAWHSDGAVMRVDGNRVPR